jgi:signal transduction histidine kinase
MDRRKFCIGKTTDQARRLAVARILEGYFSNAPGLLMRAVLYWLGYLVLHWGTFVFVLPEFKVTPWNPETGLSFLVAYLWGPATWPALLVANIAGEYITGYVSDVRGLLLRSVLYASAYTLFGVLFSRWSAANRDGSLLQIVKFLCVAGIAASIFGVLLVTGIAWMTRMPSPRLISAIVTAATGDMIGILSIAPLYVAWKMAWVAGSMQLKHYLQAFTALLIIGIACFVVFGLESTDEFKFFYLVLLPVVAIALVYGVVGAALSIFASDLMMMAIIYARDIAPATATELQILMITLSATGLVLGSVVSERRRLAGELLQSHRKLSAAQAQLLHGSRMMLINEMASAIAHEVNQPLTAVRNYCRAIQRLLYDQSNNMKLRALVSAAVEQVDVASEIINDTRRFVKREDSETANASIGDCISICGRLLQHELDRNKVRLKTPIRCDIQVRITPIKLQQVLLNLLKNSIEAIEESDGCITVRVARQEESIKISVEDTGVGLDDKTRGELFTPFSTTKEEGLGLGLSLSQNIVSEYGGELWCEHSEPGRTIMSFTLREAVVQ